MNVIFENSFHKKYGLIWEIKPGEHIEVQKGSLTDKKN